MIKDESAKLTQGTWAKLATEDVTRHPKLTFEVNIPVNVMFREEAPQEMPSQQDDGVYYMFNVVANGEERVIQTSAITLLLALKKLGNLKGKKVQIVKKINKGKQAFEVTVLE